VLPQSLESSGNRRGTRLNVVPDFFDLWLCYRERFLGKHDLQHLGECQNASKFIFEVVRRRLKRVVCPRICGRKCFWHIRICSLHYRVWLLSGNNFVTLLSVSMRTRTYAGSS